MATLLQLPPAQGGLAFGPFEGIVQLGSDPRRSQIQLDSRHGIYPLHATLALSPNGVHRFAPAEADAKCFVVRAGSPQVWPVTAVVEVKAGDSLILGTPAGPRFLLVEQPEASAREGSGFQLGGVLSVLDRLFQPRYRSYHDRSLGQGIVDEFIRRGQAQLFRQGPLREVAYLYRRARTGVLFSPYTIVGTLIALFGVLSTGVVSCFGGLVALWARLF